jgi:hypothetical protein
MAKSKIIRRPDRAEGGITADEQARFAEHNKKWIANAMRTDRADPAKVGPAIRRLYEAAGQKVPRVILVPSPRVMAFAGGISAAVWHLRKNSDATHAATHAATRDATRDATGDATHAATHAATGDATDAATVAATGAATGETIPRITSFLLGCALRWYGFYNGGNQWSAWPAYLSFFRNVARLNLPIYDKYQHYEALAECGPRFVHAKFWMVVELPTVLRIDDQNRPHCATGPSHRWQDGREIHYWHGTAVPKEWIESPGSVDPSLGLTWPNMEQRRCLQEILGWGKILASKNPRVIDRHDDPEMGELIECDMDDDNGRPGRFLRVQCGTFDAERAPHRTFVLRVAPDVKTVQEAQNRLNPLPSVLGPRDRRPEVRT